MQEKYRKRPSHNIYQKTPLIYVKNDERAKKMFCIMEENGAKCRETSNNFALRCSLFTKDVV